MSTPHHHTVKDLTIVLKSFPKKVTEDSYLQWKTQSLLTMSLHPIYKSITTRNVQGMMIVNPNIIHTDNVALYLATTTSFGDKATNYIDVSDNNATDGLLLWCRLDSKIMGEKTTFDTQDLALRFHQLKRQSNQSIESFGHSFLTQLEILSYHDMKMGTVKDLAFRFLVAINMPKLFKDQIKDMDSHKSWWENKTLREFIDKVNREYEAEKRLGSIDPAYLIKKNTHVDHNNSEKNNNNKKALDETNNDRSNDNANNMRNANNTNDRENHARPSPHLQPLALEFKSQLESDRSIQGSRATMFKWHHDNSDKCCFHNNTNSHNILQCFVTDRICREINNSNLLKEFQNSNLPSRTKDNNTQHQQTSSDPTPRYHAPPVVNPYQRHAPRYNNNLYHNTLPTHPPRRQQPIQNPYVRRNQAPTRPSQGSETAINARMAQIINTRVEEATNARMTEYLQNMEYDTLDQNPTLEGGENGYFQDEPIENEIPIEPQEPVDNDTNENNHS